MLFCHLVIAFCTQLAFKTQYGIDLVPTSFQDSMGYLTFHWESFILTDPDVYEYESSKLLNPDVYEVGYRYMMCRSYCMPGTICGCPVNNGFYSEKVYTKFLILL